MSDPRRQLPAMDVLLADARLARARVRVGTQVVKQAANAALDRARAGDVTASEVVDVALALLPSSATSMRRVLNCTGVVVHTNLGRAPLSRAAVDAMVAAAGCTDVEFDLAAGERATRGRGALDALRTAVPAAEDVLVVNNGAAALVLATTALSAGREVLVSRGELVEIGDGFRLPDLITSTGARIREVGTTNRTRVGDYDVDERTGCVLKVHPSNFTVTGFTSAAGVAELAALGAPVVADVGSGLLRPDRLLPDEPDVATALRQGAAVVTCSGDKLLGGPQAGLVFGRADAVALMRRHPMYRALRCGKTTLAALEATLNGPTPPVWQALRPERHRERTQALADKVGGEVVEAAGAVGGGGAPGVELPGWAVALDPSLAAPLRTGEPPVVGRLHKGRLLLDLRCVPPNDDLAVAAAVLACMS